MMFTEDSIHRHSCDDADVIQMAPCASSGNTPLFSACGSSVSISIDINAQLSFLSSACDTCELRMDNNTLRAEAGYWKAMHQKALERERILIEEKQTLAARVKQLEANLFGRKSENNSGNPNESLPDSTPKRKRGHQKGSPGHGRRNHDHLPAVDENYDLPEDEKCCPQCRLPFLPGFDTEDSEIVEVNVQAHVRRIHRQKYIRQCRCETGTAIITAPGPAKLIPRSVYGDSVLIEVLIDKFMLFRPTFRLIRSLELIGLDLPQGTITDALHRLPPLFEPVYQSIIQHNQNASHWHADETRWMVFSQVEGKIGYRWYLWVFQADDSAVFIVDESRSAKVPRNHLGMVEQGMLSVDRYAAYKLLAKDGKIILAFCWAHVRRDFITVARGWPHLEDWALDWLRDIGNLYHLNNLRLEAEPKSLEWQQTQDNLEQAMGQIDCKCREQLNQEKFHPACARVLKSLQNHWDGLTVFIQHSHVPMDNNSAERQLRGPVIGRKNFYGSGSGWSAGLAAMMFTLFQTLGIWDINPKTWLQHFFRACALNGSTPPDDLSDFLPWHMDDARKEVLKLPPSLHDTS